MLNLYRGKLYKINGHKLQPDLKQSYMDRTKECVVWNRTDDLRSLTPIYTRV